MPVLWVCYSSLQALLFCYTLIRIRCNHVNVIMLTRVRFMPLPFWIGLAVPAIVELVSRKAATKNAAILATVVCLAVGPVLTG